MQFCIAVFIFFILSLHSIFSKKPYKSDFTKTRSKLHLVQANQMDPEFEMFEDDFSYRKRQQGASIAAKSTFYVGSTEKWRTNEVKHSRHEANIVFDDEDILPDGFESSGAGSSKNDAESKESVDEIIDWRSKNGEGDLIEELNENFEGYGDLVPSLRMDNPMKRYYQITLTIGEPFTAEFNNEHSIEYQTILAQLFNGFKEVFSRDEVEGVSLRNVRPTEDIFRCTATINVKILTRFGRNELKRILQTYIENRGKVGEVPATMESFRFEESEECEANDSSCDDMNCVAMDKQCDRAEGCLDESYDLNCPVRECPPGDFHCFDGTCLPGHLQCNNRNDCQLGEDELNCHCDTEIGEKYCRDGTTCVRDDQFCDSVQDCPSNEDEENCQSTTIVPYLRYYCLEGKFTCHDLSCISITGRCDGKVDCPQDRADEENCPCLYDKWQCDDGTCISARLRCDGNLDCPEDLSDERNCETEFACGIDEWRCDNGLCISVHKFCNLVYDCDDFSDERDCANRGMTADDCSFDEFFCDDTCHLRLIRCNGHTDCLDRTDEDNCVMATTEVTVRRYDPRYPCPELACPTNGKCFRYSEKCDSTRDCDDGYDELECPCKEYEFSCHDQQTCVSMAHRCDGYYDCRDFSDEQDCYGCQSNEFKCNDGACILASLQCDGRPDCPDGSDENCSEYPGLCRTNEWTCNNGQCVSVYSRCDRRPDCTDGSDEWECPSSQPADPQLNLKTYPPSQVIRESREVVFRCRDEGPTRARVKWARSGGLPLPAGSKDTEGRLEIPNIRESDSGEYVCEAIGFPPQTAGQSVRVVLTVERFNPYSNKTQGCGPLEATCMNGGCIPKSQICDNQTDCTDGSDEYACSMGRGCHPDEFMCKNSRCVTKLWVCDGDDDCGDQSDEESCDLTPSGSPCRSFEFQCGNGQCIPRSFHCDGTNECQDGSDEFGCIEPHLVTPPEPVVVLQTGATLNLTCRAVGVPTPLILWRRNWGFVPEKCVSTSVDGFGVLTCPNMYHEDSGAYSCEMLNVKDRVFATPDANVVVEPDRGVCPNGFFNVLARQRDDCISCFCFGVSNECRSADLYVLELQPPITSHHVVGVYFPSDPYGDLEFTDYSAQSQLSIFHGPEFRASGIPFTQDIPYLSLPAGYHGNQLKSYGGLFKYEVVFSGDGLLTSTPYVILSGNSYKLVHKGELNLRPHVRNQVKIRFVPDQWTHSNGSRASREELMMVLANVETILVKLQYVDHAQRELEIMHITMDSASWDDRGLGAAPLVEHCTCPPGYVGHSCESCAPGYVRVNTGSWLGRCVMTAECESGQYGDPSRGIPCRRCPCPLTNPENNFARSCSLGADGNAICHCYRGYTGVRCEQCEIGFEGNPVQPGGRCVETPVNVCDPYGTEYQAPNGTCICKSNVQGYYCDQCKPNTFSLNEHSLTGCTACFCMGVTKTCTSSSWYRDTIHARFGGAGYDHGFSLVADINPDETEPIGDYLIEQVDNELRFTGRNDDRILYWSLPPQFLGDKVFSYGGYLNYTIRYNPQPGGSMSKNNAPDVIIKSNRHVKFFHHRKTDVFPGIPQTYSVPIVETVFERTDGILVNREHVLMSLSDVSAIYIKATYTTVTDEAAISHVSLDIATPQNTGRQRAVEVEQCSCPVGHFGLSCQSCTPGYTKGIGLYLGVCEPCDCNGHSEECDAETGECYNCRDNTAGEHCDECAPGFIGNATSGRPYDCVPSGSGDACQGCDPRGTLRCDQGSCICKQNVEGFYCSQCRRGSYNLQESNVDGCTECYCSGVSRTCRSSILTRMPIPSMLSYMDIKIADYDGKVALFQNVQAEMERNDIVSDFDSLRGTYFWSLPYEGFLGNQLNAYGGLLEFDIVADGYGSYVPSEDVILRGKGMTLIWSRPPGTENRRHVSVRLHESDRWNLYDVRGLLPASHEVFLQVLSDVNQLLIRATLKSPTRDSRLGNITIHKAVPSSDGEPAYEVEVCQCPPGYSGDVCESCSPFHYRDMQNECVRCPCNTNGTEECVSLSNGFYECRCRQSNEGPLCQYPVDYQPYPPVPTQPSPSHSNVSIEIKITSMPQRFVQVGESVILDCSGHIIFTSTPIPVTWYKVDNELPLYATEDQGRLYLHNLQPSDSGIYVCRGRYKDEVVTANVTIIVGSQPTKPRVTLSPPYVTVEENESVSVHCEAIGEPAPQITWQRGDGHSQLPSSAYLDNEYLRFRNIRKQDEGLYHCLAQNSEGYVDGSVQIYVNSLAPVPLPPGPSSIYIDPPTGVHTRPGDEFELVCYGPAGDNWYYTWTKNNIPLQSGGNVRIDQGVLKITQCRSYDSGVYTCEAEDPRTGRREYTSVTVHIDEPSYEPIVIKEMPQEHTVVQGRNYTLVCEASGSPSPTVKWTMHHSSPDSNVFLNNNVLTIVNARISNRGYYVCIAESGSQSKQAFVMIDVEPREVPLLEILPQNPFIAYVGEQATFHCRDVQGIPKPTMRWTRRDGAPLPSNAFDSDGTLTFENVHVENAGEYECSANNVAGFATEYIQLIVHEAPIVTTHPEGSLTLYEGEALLLECYATGHPAPTVTWNDNHLGSSYQPAIFDQNQRQRATLRINSVTSADTRQYVCTAANDVGTDAKTVSVIVRPRGGTPSHPQPSVRPPSYPPYTVGVGDRAELSCEVENLNGNTRWHRVDGRPLPSGSIFSGSHLIIESVQLSDAGQYECIVYDDYEQRHISVTAEIIVLPSPRITFSPPMPMHVSSGEDVVVYCNVSGDRPIHIKWHAENHRPLPPTVVADGATLRFPRITPSDAGRYYCAAENIHGNTTKVAEVLVKHNRPELTYTVGDTVELACDESYGREPGMKYHWLRQGGDIPLNAERRDSRLILRNIQQQDAGRYTCEIISLNQVRASNTADVYVKHMDPIQRACKENFFKCRSHPHTCIIPSRVCDGVNDCTDHSDEHEGCDRLRRWHNNRQTYKIIAAVPSNSKPEIVLKSYRPFIRPGEIVELECMSEVDFAQTVWERERQLLPVNAKQYGNKLIITDVRAEDSGRYICMVFANDGNSFSSSYFLEVEDDLEPVPQPPPHPHDRNQKLVYTDVQSTVTLVCEAKFYGGTYKWTRLNGQFAPNVDTTQSELVLSNVQARDAGTYVCTSHNNGETYESETILVIIGAMPYFPQAPNSYIVYPPPENEFSKLRFSISFKPESPNGLILYNGHKYGSYIALSLDDGYPEFRYNFHNDDIVIRAEKPIELGKWHTVKVNRARLDGFMTVDDQPPVAFPTAEEFHEFNVADKLYVGSVPKWEDIPPAAVGRSTGFVGCVSRLVLSNRIVELNEDALHKENTTSCEPCANDPCQNDGICLESQAELGYSCICQEGFTGRNCGVIGTSCTLDTCGVGRCENTDTGFECYCPVHTAGERCQYNEPIDGDSLSFKSNGYAAYKTPKATKLSISFSIRPNSLEDSIIMYAAESATSVGDYIAVILRNHHIELIVSIGARLDPLIIRSRYPIESDKWTDIHISRKTGVTYLTVGNEDQQHIRSKGNTRNMFLSTHLYVGGYDNRIELGKSINVSQGFDGCIARLNSSNEPFHMLRDLKEGANVQSCRTDNDIDPFQNGNSYDEDELCDDGLCMNGGTCIATEHGTTYCQCPIGSAGEFCEDRVEIESSIFFRGDGYLELNRSTISSVVDEYTTYLGVQFSTLAPDGLIFWYGQRKDEPFNGNDFMALSLVDGYAEFAFRLDNEEGRVRHGQARLNDGLTHLVKLERQGNEGSIEIMNNVNNFQTIPKQRKEMHLPGHIFIGGAPDLEKFTGKRFIHGFRGCISGFENDQSGPINFVRNAVSSSKVDKCPSGELLDPDDFASDFGTEPPAL